MSSPAGCADSANAPSPAPLPEAGAGLPATGRDRLSVPFRDVETLAEELASYGPRAVAVSPPELVTSVRRRLAAAADFAAAPVPPIAFPAVSSRPGRPGAAANALPRTS